MVVVFTSNCWIWMKLIDFFDFSLKQKETIQTWNIFDHLIATQSGMSGKCGIKDPLPPTFLCRSRHWINSERPVRPIKTMPDNLVFFSSCVAFIAFIGNCLGCKTVCVCVRNWPWQSQRMICFHQPWSPGFGMHSRGRGDGCCFWDDDYVLVLFCLNTASYLWFHSKKQR